MSARRAHPDEWQRLRELRLRALRDEPDAFTARYEDEAAYADDEWREWAAETFVAGDWQGMAASFLVEGGSARLVAMYVVPAARRRGYGAQLVAAVEQWAREQGAPKVILWVTPANEAARALYERCGYRATGAVRDDGSLLYERHL